MVPDVSQEGDLRSEQTDQGQSDKQGHQNMKRITNSKWGKNSVTVKGERKNLFVSLYINYRLDSKDTWTSCPFS